MTNRRLSGASFSISTAAFIAGACANDTCINPLAPLRQVFFLLGVGLPPELRFSLPAPTQKAKGAETGDEERECGWKRDVWDETSPRSEEKTERHITNGTLYYRGGCAFTKYKAGDNELQKATTTTAEVKLEIDTSSLHGSAGAVGCIQRGMRMSLQMVMRYSKHIDGERLARRGNAKREQNAVEFVKPDRSRL